MHGISPEDEIDYWRDQAKRWQQECDAACIRVSVCESRISRVVHALDESGIPQYREPHLIHSTAERVTMLAAEAKRWQAKAEAAEQELAGERDKYKRLDEYRAEILGNNALALTAKIKAESKYARACGDREETMRELDDVRAQRDEARAQLSKSPVSVLAYTSLLTDYDHTRALHAMCQANLATACAERDSALHALANERQVVADLRGQVARYERLTKVVRGLTCDGCEYDDNCPSGARHYVCRTCHLTSALSALDGAKP